MNHPPASSFSRLSVRVLPLIGLLAGCILWVVDAGVDVFVLGERQTLLENIVDPEPAEAWMRTLVVLVMLGFGILARMATSRQAKLNEELHAYRFNLEAMVAERTAELSAKQEELQRLATTDPLTETYNRRKFYELVEAEIARSQRHGRVFTIAMLDIDHFKQINDCHGHAVGDCVLVEMAHLLRTSMRASDVLARWGGEEFIVLLPETEISSGVQFGEKLRRSCEQHAYTGVDSVTVSIGVAGFMGTQEIGPLLRAADEALYRAKQEGRNRVAV